MGSTSPRIALPEAACQLGVTQSMLERWVRQGLVPSHRTGGEEWFEPSELSAWARIHGLRSAGTHPARTAFAEDFLARAIERGAVLAGVEAHSVVDVVEAATGALAEGGLISSVEHSELTRQVLERERMASTALGKGVAVPHPRDPQGRLVAEPVVVVVFPEPAVDWAALDGLDVHTAFLLVSPNAREHLQVLSRLAFAMRTEGFAAWLRGRPSRDELVTRLREISPEA